MGFRLEPEASFFRGGKGRHTVDRGKVGEHGAENHARFESLSEE